MSFADRKRFWPSKKTMVRMPKNTRPWRAARPLPADGEQFCQGQRDIGPVGRSESVPPEVFGQRKCPCQLFRGSVTETGQLQVGEWVSEDGFWHGLGVV